MINVRSHVSRWWPVSYYSPTHLKKKQKKNNNDTFSENYESGFLAGGENRSDFRFTFLGRHFFFVLFRQRKKMADNDNLKKERKKKLFYHHTPMDGWSRNDFLNSTVRFSNFELIKNTKLNSNPILSLCVNREVLRYHPRRCHCQSRWISPPASKSWNTRHPHVLIIVVKYICPSDCVRRRRTGGFCVSDGGTGIENQSTNSLRLLDDRKEDKVQSRERRWWWRQLYNNKQTTTSK